MAKKDDITIQGYRDFISDLLYELHEVRAIVRGAESMFQENVDADSDEDLTYISYLHGVASKKLVSVINQLDESTVSDFAKEA